MSLLTCAEARAQLQTSLTDDELQDVIDREEACVIRRCGPHYVDADTSFTTTLEGGLPSLWFTRPLSKVVSITEDGTVLDADAYRVWPDEGRIERLGAPYALYWVDTERLQQPGLYAVPWGSVVEVTYVPADDTAERKAVILELVRIALERTAMRSEDVANEYSYSAPDWEAERSRLIRRLRFLGA